MKLLPTMRRLVEQICQHYELTILSIEKEQEHTTNFYGQQIHRPVYHVCIDIPNRAGIYALYCAPLNPYRSCYSMSTNNVVVRAAFEDGSKKIIPSWRGKIIIDVKELKKYDYQIRKGYLPL